MMVRAGFEDMVVALDQRVRGLWFGGGACRSQAAAFEVWTFLTVDAGDHERAAGRAGIEHQCDRHLGVEPDAPRGFGAAWTRTGCTVIGLEQAPLRVH